MSRLTQQEQNLIDSLSEVNDDNNPRWIMDDLNNDNHVLLIDSVTEVNFILKYRIFDGVYQYIHGVNSHSYKDFIMELERVINTVYVPMCVNLEISKSLKKF